MKSLGPDRVHVPWTQRAGGDQVDRPAEGGLEAVGERDEIETDLGVDVDEDVDIASVGLVTACKRAEDGQVAHAEAADEVGLHRPKDRDDVFAGPNHDGPSLDDSREMGLNGGGAFVARENGRPSTGAATPPLVLSLVLFPSAAANLGYPRIVTGGAACRVLGSTRRA